LVDAGRVSTEAPVFDGLVFQGRTGAGTEGPGGFAGGNPKPLRGAVFNYAWSLDGVQLGLLNIVRDNPPGRRVLPIINW
jgi:hypothetical protein